MGVGLVGGDGLVRVVGVVEGVRVVWVVEADGVFAQLLLYTICQHRSVVASFLFSRTVRRGFVNIYYDAYVAQLF